MYDEASVKVLEGLEPVRVRPGMYIGDTGALGFHHLVWEIIDNSVDEAKNGHANRIEVTMLGPRTIRVTDNGRGIPTGIHPTYGRSSLEIILTKLHSGPNTAPAAVLPTKSFKFNDPPPLSALAAFFSSKSDNCL